MDYSASVTPCVSSMDISDCPFDSSWSCLPQASLSRLLCDLCRSEGDQRSFIFKPGKRWKQLGSKISCGVRWEHQREKMSLFLEKLGNVSQFLMSQIFSCEGFTFLKNLQERIKTTEAVNYCDSKATTMKHGLSQKVQMKIKDKVVKNLSWLKPFVIIFPMIKSNFLPLFKYLSTTPTFREREKKYSLVCFFCSLDILCSFIFLMLNGFVFIENICKNDSPRTVPRSLLICFVVSVFVMLQDSYFFLNALHRFRDI